MTVRLKDEKVVKAFTELRVKSPVAMDTIKEALGAEFAEIVKYLLTVKTLEDFRWFQGQAVIVNELLKLIGGEYVGHDTTPKRTAR